MTGKQPKTGNVKITLSVKAETREALKQCATSTRKIGAVIDDIFKEEKHCVRCGSPDPKFRTLDTKEKLCDSCTIAELKKGIGS